MRSPGEPELGWDDPRILNFALLLYRTLPVQGANREIAARADPAGEAQLGVDAIAFFDQSLSIRLASQAFGTFDDLESAARTGPVFPACAGDREADLPRGLEERHFLYLDLDRPARRQKANRTLHDAGVYQRTRAQAIP